MKRVMVAVGAVIALGAVSLVPLGDEFVQAPGTTSGGFTMDLSSYPADPPDRGLNFLLIHHSVGGQLLADQGPAEGRSSIHLQTHPNGGGLRRLLTEAGYRVHEAAYDSEVGNDTDLRHWGPKFRDQLDRILRVRMQDDLLPEGERNHIVGFKSCFPNSSFVAQGASPGDGSLPQLTVENAKAAMRELLPIFMRHPDTLFVYFTAPPLAPRIPAEPAWKWLAKRLLGRGMTAARLQESARLARSFNDWMKSRDGWLATYEGDNVAVFDYFDLLTGEGRSNLLFYPTRDGLDSHPSADGQARAAAAFVPFLNRAVRRAGLVE